MGKHVHTYVCMKPKYSYEYLLCIRINLYDTMVVNLLIWANVANLDICSYNSYEMQSLLKQIIRNKQSNVSVQVIKRFDTFMKPAYSLTKCNNHMVQNIRENVYLATIWRPFMSVWVFWVKSFLYLFILFLVIFLLKLNPSVIGFCGLCNI